MGRLVSVFGLPPDVVAATLGDIGVEEVVSLTTGVSPVYSTDASCNNAIFRIQIPDNLAIGVDRCLQKCNLKRGEQTMNQLQPREDGNATY
jgi:hypothetical protein